MDDRSVDRRWSWVLAIPSGSSWWLRTLEATLPAPGVNRLESLKGDRAGQRSLRVNDQFRICFRWTGSDAEDVEIVDYHRGMTR